MANDIWGSSTGNPYPQTPLVDETTKLPTRAWQQFFLNLLNFSSSQTANRGTVNLPSNPVGFINITVNGKPFKVPYYNP
jgi:hypothetical protein